MWKGSVKIEFTYNIIDFTYMSLNMKSTHYTQIFLFLSNFLLSCEAYESTSPLIVYQCRLPTISYPNEKAKNDAINQGRYVQNNVLLLDSDCNGNRYFVTSPPFRPSGIPCTLSELNVATGLLKPFPNFPTYMNSTSISCQSLYSVFRTQMDDCGRMWVIDSGRNVSVTPNYLHCPPKLLIYDLNDNDREILRYEFPYGVYTDRSLIVNVIVESSKADDCSRSHAYLADVQDYALIVFSLYERNSWRIQHKYFYPFPTAMTFNVTSQLFVTDSYDGIFGSTLGPKTEKNRKLYYHSLASVQESWAPISILKNESAANDAQVSRKSYVLSSGQRNGQSTIEVMTDDGILIYALISTNQLACWNSSTPFTRENQHIIKTDDKRFQFIAGMKLYNNVLYITSCRFQSYTVGLEKNGTDPNYRIMVVRDVKKWLECTSCISR